MVLSDVGCTHPMIDDHDVRVIRETLTGTHTYSGSVSSFPGLPDSQDDVGGWEDYPEITRPAHWDSDHDGLPDWWERIKGLNANSPAGDFSDSNADLEGDEYTELERYLNWMAEPHFDCARNGVLGVDLSALTRGFASNAVYSITTATNGVAVLLSDGKTARFTPTAGFEGLGGFQFAVTDDANSGMNRSVGIHISAAAAVPSPPLLGIREQGGALYLEVTGESGLSVTVERSTALNTVWLEWTNIIADGTMQLVPLPGLVGESRLFLRAVVR